MEQCPRAHLLMGPIGAEKKLPTRYRSRAALLEKLVSLACRRGSYAVTILRNLEEGDVAMVGVEHGVDADRVARVVDARVAPRFGRWHSHRAFAFDADAALRLASSLAAGGKRRIAGTA